MSETIYVGKDGHLNGIDKQIIELARTSMVDGDRLKIVFSGQSNTEYSAHCHFDDGEFSTFISKNGQKIATIYRQIDSEGNDGEEVVMYGVRA